MMDFESYNSVAKLWTDSNDTSFKISSVSEKERKFTFHVPDTDISFYVIYPETPENTDWVVWSDSEEVLMNLQVVQDFIESSKQRSFIDVLKKVDSEIKPLYEEDTDEGDDGVYEEDTDEGDDGDDVEDDYYRAEDIDAEGDVSEQNSNVADEDEAENFFAPSGTAMATKRLVKDLKNMQNATQFGIEGSPRGDNLFIWDVKLTDIPKDCRLGKDLDIFATKYEKEPVLYLEMQFPGEYPMSPPFVRVIKPRFKFLTGHVTIGGSICMQMLTKSGWRPTNDIESILVQIRSEIMSDPNACLDANPDKSYGEKEAKDAFDRMVQKYGWNK